MTEDQIRAIAEEYARLNPPSTNDEKLKQDGIHLNATMVFEPFLRFINERFCIAEREKVMNAYKEASEYCNSQGITTSAVGTCERVMLNSLFGTSMFNQNEE